jgi:CubicO group peptidase (beta-lactamase class C family)
VSEFVGDEPVTNHALAAELERTAGRRVPGLSAALVRDEQVVWRGAAGSPISRDRTPARATSVYL